MFEVDSGASDLPLQIARFSLRFFGSSLTAALLCCKFPTTLPELFFFLSLLQILLLYFYYSYPLVTLFLPYLAFDSLVLRPPKCGSNDSFK